MRYIIKQYGGTDECFIYRGSYYILESSNIDEHKYNYAEIQDTDNNCNILQKVEGKGQSKYKYYISKNKHIQIH